MERMEGRTGGRSARWLIVVAVLVAGCAGVDETMRKRLDGGDAEGALAAGREWIREDGPKADPGQRARVALLVAEAELGVALKTGQPEPLRRFRDEHREPAYEALARQAYQAEAKLRWRRLGPEAPLGDLRAFRDAFPGTGEEQLARAAELEGAERAAKEAGAIPAEQEFRARYGAWPEAARQVEASRARELDLADRAARGSASSERAFRERYSDRPEAAAALAASRVREVGGAWEAAKAAATVAALAGFQVEYRGWPEAGGLLPLARAAEAAAALDEAGEDTGRLRAVASGYPEAPWPARASERLAAVLAARVAAALREVAGPSDEDVDALLAPDVPRAAVAAALAPLEADLWAAAERGGRSAPWRAYAAIFSASPRAAEAVEREVGAAWAEAEAANDTAAWMRFVESHPGHPRSLAAERNAVTLRRLEGEDRAAPKVEVARRQRLPSGEVELTLDVTRCGRRVAGLRRGAFEVYVGATPQPVTGFLSLEDERPLRVVFALDLSGSMATERQAVREAIVQFAETFRFRGRRASFGLVTFNELIREVRPATTSASEFRAWVDRIGAAEGGGGGEDTVGSLFSAADVAGAGEGERVVILLTDEPLQINMGGQLRVASTPRACDGVIASFKAFKACRSDDCRLEAFGRAHRVAAEASRQCIRARGRALCGRELAATGDPLYAALFQACSGGAESRVDAASIPFQRLQETLARKGVRPYLLVPTELAAAGPFVELATALEGTAIGVDDDSSDPETFVTPLLAIADQLSKQYVVRYRPGDPSAAAPAARVLVRLDHDWSAWGETAGKVASLAPLGEAGRACQELAAVTTGGALLRSRDCARRFEAWPSGAAGRVLAIAPDGGGGVYALSEGGLLSLHGDGAPAPVSSDLATVESLVAAPDGAAWLVGADADGRPAVARRAQGDTGFRRVSIGLFARPVALLPGPGTAVCAVLPGGQRTCRDESGTVTSGAAAGVAAGAPGPVTALPGRRGGWLWAPADGPLLRTLDEGAHFTEVLPPVPGGWRLTLRPGASAILCAASTRATRCSEDLGLSWFPAGQDLDQSAASVAIASAGGQVFVDRGTRLERLTRVVNRDIPSSAVYFPTDVDTPDASIRPFLAELGRTLAREPGLVLRVEGHADRRGGEEHNDALSLRRAKAVAALVVGAGADGARVEVTAHGARRPVRTGDAAEDHSRNRRVELLLMRPLEGMEAGELGEPGEGCEGEPP